MLEKSKQVFIKLLREPSFYVAIVLLVFIWILAIYKTGESGSWAIIGSAITAALAYVTQSAIEIRKEEERRKNLSAAFFGEIHAILSLAETRGYLETFYAEYINIERNRTYPPLDKFLNMQFGDYFAVYRSNVNHIGDMDSDILPLITEFYLKIFSLMEDMTMIPGALLKNARKMCPDERSAQAGYINILCKTLAQDIDIFMRVIDVGKQICDILSSRYDIPCEPVFKQVKSYAEFLDGQDSNCFLPEYQKYFEENYLRYNTNAL